MLASKRTLQLEAQRNREERARLRQSRSARQTGFEARLARDDEALRLSKSARDSRLVSLPSGDLGGVFSGALPPLPDSSLFADFLTPSVTSDGPVRSTGRKLSEREREPRAQTSLGPSDVTAPANPRRLFNSIRAHQRKCLEIDGREHWRQRSKPIDRDRRATLEDSRDRIVERYRRLQDYVLESLKDMCEHLRDPDHGLTRQQWWCLYREVLYGTRWFLRGPEHLKKAFLDVELRRWPLVLEMNRASSRAYKARPQYKSDEAKAERALAKKAERASWTEERRRHEREKNSELVRARRAAAKAARFEASNVPFRHGDMVEPAPLGQPEALRRLRGLDGAQGADLPPPGDAGPRGLRPQDAAPLGLDADGGQDAEEVHGVPEVDGARGDRGVPHVRPPQDQAVPPSLLGGPPGLDAAGDHAAAPRGDGPVEPCPADGGGAPGPHWTDDDTLELLMA
jgi:hypothetical protein